MGDDTSPGRHYSHDAKTMGSSAVIASVLGSLLVVGIVLVVTNSNDVNAPAEAQQTELMTELMAESPPDSSRCKFVNDREAWDCPNPNPKHCKDGISRITRKCCDPNFDPPPPSTDWCMTPNGTTPAPSTRGSTKHSRICTPPQEAPAMQIPSVMDALGCPTLRDPVGWVLTTTANGTGWIAWVLTTLGSIHSPYRC